MELNNIKTLLSLRFVFLTIYCASCGERLGDTEPQFPCPEWHNDEEPYWLDPAYPGPEAGAVRSSSTTVAKDGNADDSDHEHDNNDSQAYRDLLSALIAMGFPNSRARMALSTIYNQSIDAAVGWLNINRPPSPEPEPIPDPDPTWGQWRPIRSCFWPKLTNIPARDWIQNAAITTVKHAQNAKQGMCYGDITQVDVIMRLIVETALFTVRDMPIQDNAPTKNMPIKDFAPVRSEEVARYDARTTEEIREDEEFAKAIRRSLGD